MISIMLGFIFLLIPLATTMPVYYENFQNNLKYSNDVKDNFQYTHHSPNDNGNLRSIPGIQTNDADEIVVTTLSYGKTEDQVPASIEPQEELSNEEDQVTAATEPQEDLTSGADQVTAPTKQQELTDELTDEELRELEVQNLFDVKENRIIDIVIGVGASVIGLLIVLCLGGRHIYLKCRRTRRKSIWREAKRKKSKERLPEVTVEEGLPQDTDAIPSQDTPQEFPPTTSEGRKVTFDFPSSELMKSQQKRGKPKVPEAAVEEGIPNDTDAILPQITPQESPPTSSMKKKVTFNLPPSPRSSSPPSLLTKLSIVPSVESKNTSQSFAKVPLVEFPIDPSNAPTLATIYYGQSSAASSITFQFVSEGDK